MSNTSYFHVLSLCGFGDILSHLTRIKAVKKKYPEHIVKFWLGGFGKAPQFSKEQIEREGYEAMIVKNLNFHNQLPAIRKLFLDQVVQENDIFEDWSFCEEIFQNKEPSFMQYDMEFPYNYSIGREKTEDEKWYIDFTKDDSRALVAIHPLTKSGNAEGFEHDLQAGRFWDKDKWVELCVKLIQSNRIPAFIGMGDEDWGVMDELDKMGYKAFYQNYMGFTIEEQVRFLQDGCRGCIATNSWDWEISSRAGLPTICFYTKNHFFIKIHTLQGPSEFWDNCYIETDNKVTADSIFDKFIYMDENKKRPQVKYSACMITLDDEEDLENEV
jgi:hypothetical protein